MPTAVAKPTPAAPTAPDPMRRFALYPANSERGYVELRVVAEERETQLAMRQRQADGLTVCRRVLMEARTEFFATGPGRELREKEARLREAEQRAADSERAVGELRTRWRAAVATDSTDDVVALELALDEHGRALERLKVRVPVLAEDVARGRKAAATELLALLKRRRDEFEARAESALADALAKLKVAVNGVYAEWVTAAAERHGVNDFNGDLLYRMASSAEEVPTKHTIDPATMPNLPAPPPPPPPTDSGYAPIPGMA